MTCVTETAACALLEFAKFCPDVEAEFAGLTSSQIIAKEFKYHRTCYRSLSSKVYSSTSKSKNEITEDELRESCFDDLIEYIKDSIIGEGNVVKMSVLTEIYRTLQKEKNIPIKGADNRLLKDRSKRYFIDDMYFFQKGQGKPDLVYSDVSPKEIQQSKQIQQSKHVTQKIEEVARLIREDIQSFNSVFEQWPPESQRVRAKYVQLPNLLEVPLKSILRSDPYKESDWLKRLVKSLSQDILFNATNGRVKTVKHLQLGMFLKRKTGSKEILTTLNRLGHCLSYPELLRLETNIAEIESSIDAKDYIPTQVVKDNFVTYVYDNCDHNPETLSGVSMHCTNGIMIQRPSDISRDESVQLTIEHASKDTSKRRSFEPINTSILPYKKPRNRPTPQLIEDVIVENNLFFELVSKTADWIWLFARYQAFKFTNCPRLVWISLSNNT